MSEAADLYQRRIVETARRRGTWPLASATGTGRADNPLCGDRAEVAVRIEDGRIAALGHRVRGCLLCEAAGTVIAETAIGLSPDALRQVARDVTAMLAEGAPPPWPDLAIFEPVRAHRSRHQCVALPFQALLAALDDAGDIAGDDAGTDADGAAQAGTG